MGNTGKISAFIIALVTCAAALFAAYQSHLTAQSAQLLKLVYLAEKNERMNKDCLGRAQSLGWPTHSLNRIKFPKIVVFDNGINKDKTEFWTIMFLNPGVFTGDTYISGDMSLPGMGLFLKCFWRPSDGSIFFESSNSSNLPQALAKSIEDDRIFREVARDLNRELQQK